MIITSNSVTHEYVCPELTIIGEVDGFENVAKKVRVEVYSSTTFDHTYETVLSNPDGGVGIATTLTQEKTVSSYSAFSVTLATSGIGTTSFTAWEDLQEDQVIQWAMDKDPLVASQVKEKQETIVLKEKEKVLYPRRHLLDTPVPPWVQNNVVESD